MLLRPIQLPINIPVGAGLEQVNEDDPRLRRHPVVIVGSVGTSADEIYRKYTDYRTWHGLRETMESDLIPIGGRGGFADLIQDLYQRGEDDDPDHSDGIDLIGVIYTKADESKVTEWLSTFPPALPFVADSHMGSVSPVIYGCQGQSLFMCMGEMALRASP